MSKSIKNQLITATCLVLFVSSVVVAQENAGATWTVALYKRGQKPVTQGNTFYVGLYSRKPQLVTVPSLTGMTWDEASQTLTDLGLIAEKNNASGLHSDSVRNQNVTAGKKVYTGTTVRVGLVAIVPNIVGMTFSEAYSTLTDECGFKMKYNTNLSAEYKVTHQKPSAGSVLARGQSVSAACMVQVPSVEGLTVSEAQEKLAEAKLNNSLATEFESSDLVLKQTNAGRTVPALSVIKLTPGVEVPNLIGMGGNRANAELVRTGVKGNARVKLIPTPNQFMHGRSTVVWQGYRAGQYISRTQTMNVNITKYIYTAPRPTVIIRKGRSGSGTIKNGINGGNTKPCKKPIRVVG